MKTITEIQNEIIADFEMFDDWADKYEYIIDMGKNLAPIPSDLKTEDNIIKGCQSLVWLTTKFENNHLYFLADSDAIITKGLIGLLAKVLSGQNPQDIAEADLFFMKKIGLQDHLSPTRANGLLAMVKQMKSYGLAFLAKEKMA